MNIDLNNERGDGSSLTSPHFDDERTLLSARAVVPLGKVESRSRFKRWLPLLGTAVLGGTLTGVLMVQIGRARGSHAVEKQNSEDTTHSEPTSIKDGSSSAVANNPKPLDSPGAGEANAAPDNSTAALKAQPKSKKPVPDSKENLRLDEQKDSAADVWTRRDLRREAKRLERRAEREANRGRYDRTDDLFRIRDIFEGTRRP